MNPAHVAMFEAASKEDLLNHAVNELYRDPVKRQELSDRLLRQGFVKNEEIELRTVKGKPIWGSVTAVVKQDETGRTYFDGVKTSRPASAPRRSIRPSCAPPWTASGSWTPWAGSWM